MPAFYTYCINAYVNSNMEDVTESSKGNQSLNTFVLYITYVSAITKMTVVDMQTKSNC